MSTGAPNQRGHLHRCGTGMMHSMQLVAPQRFERVGVPIPKPRAAEVLVRVEGCGVCGSNLPAWEGRAWFQYPFEPGAPGHEAWGEVVAVGPGVDPELVGRRAAILSDHGFAEFAAVPLAKTVWIPESLQGCPVPGEPIACAINIMRRAGVRPGDTVCVVGAGFIGLLLILLARIADARVIACSRRDFSRNMARRVGAEAAVALDRSGSAEGEIARITQDRMCDVVIEAAGVQEAIDAATPLVRTRGRLVIAGFHQDGQRTVDLQRWNWHGIDVINAHERDPAVYARGMREGIEAMRAGRLMLDGLLTHTLPMTHLDHACALLSDRPAGFVKAVVVP